MLLIERPPLPRQAAEDPEALIKEAKRLRRRRWAIGTMSLAAAIGAITVVILLSGRSSKAPFVARASSLPSTSQ